MSTILRRIGLPVLLAWLSAAPVAMAYGPLSPSELNKSPEKYQGKDVVVGGFALMFLDSDFDHVLYDSKRILIQERREYIRGDHENDRDYKSPYCLTIANPEFFWPRHKNLRLHNIKVRGTFIADYLSGGRIDLGACSIGTAIWVKEIIDSW